MIHKGVQNIAVISDGNFMTEIGIINNIKLKYDVKTKTIASCMCF